MKPIVLPWIAACICLLSLLLIGMAAPVFLEMYSGFGIDPLPLHLRIVALIHWIWTVPVGLFIASILIWGTKHWSRVTNLRIDVAAIVVAITVILAFAYATLFIPVGGMRTIPEKAAEENGGHVR